MLWSASIGWEEKYGFSWDLKDAAESLEWRLGLREFRTDGTEKVKTYSVDVIRIATETVVSLYFSSAARAF